MPTTAQSTLWEGKQSRCFTAKHCPELQWTETLGFVLYGMIFWFGSCSCPALALVLDSVLVLAEHSCTCFITTNWMLCASTAFWELTLSEKMATLHLGLGVRRKQFSLLTLRSSQRKINLKEVTAATIFNILLTSPGILYGSTSQYIHFDVNVPSSFCMYTH